MTVIKQLQTNQTFFDLFQLAEGVYAAVGLHNPAAYSNAAIIDLGNQTLLFDTFSTPGAGRELRLVAERLTERKTEIIINSHAHTHHWMGNQVFEAETTIVTTHANRLAMNAMADYLLALKNDPSEFETQIRKNRKRLQNSTDRRWQVTLEYLIGRMQASLGSLPEIAPRLPNQTFESRLAFHGPGRCVEVVEGRGHSASDAYLFLPEERIVFMSDLGAFHRQPLMPYGDTAIWLAELARFEQMEADVFVPGHGPVGDKSDIALQSEYMRLLLDMVDQVYTQGGGVQDVIDASLSEPFDGWLVGGMHHFEANVKAVFHHKAEK